MELRLGNEFDPSISLNREIVKCAIGAMNSLTSGPYSFEISVHMCSLDSWSISSYSRFQISLDKTCEKHRGVPVDNRSVNFGFCLFLPFSVVKCLGALLSYFEATH